MKKSALILSALVTLALSASLGSSVAEAAGKGYASARKVCLAQAGTDEATFSNRRATFAQGAIYKQCMASKGHDVVVRRGDGSRLY